MKLVRGFYDYSAGRDLLEALADEQYVAAGHAAFGQLAAPDFEFVLVRDEGGDQVRLLRAGAPNPTPTIAEILRDVRAQA